MRPTVATATGQAISIDMQRLALKSARERRASTRYGRHIPNKNALYSVSKIPWLIDLPGLGVFFRSTKEEIQHTRSFNFCNASYICVILISTSIKKFGIIEKKN